MQIKKILPVSFLLLVTLLFSNTALAYSDGSLDTVFNPGTGTNSRIVSTVLQPDGKILIGGYFTSYNGTTRNGVARINSDGSLDATFNPGTGIAGGADTSVRSVSVQSDGKIIIGGSFMTYNGVARQNLARLNTDGTLDATFDSSLGANNTVRATAVQSDGKILIGGDFTSYEDIGLGRIARLNSNGTLDSSFNPGIGVDDSVAIITFQSDGKILIGGYFTNYDGTSRNGIARLNTNGSLDATFNPGTGTNNGVHSISFQSNGKLIIGGGYTLYNGVSRRSIARLNTDGSLDNTFNPGSGANNTIFSAPIQSDGKILVAGDFTTFNGLSYNRIARLNTDGSLDATFNPGLGANFVINSIAIPSDNYVIIGGSFNTYNGTSRNNIARLGVVSVQVPTPTNPPDMTSATDTGVSNNDNITSDNTPDFQMICVSGNTVTLYIDNVAISPTALCVGNTAIITPAVALSNDAHNVTYTEKNGGVESGKSPVLAISIQTNTSLITVLEIAPIGVTGDITPNYIFSTDKAGTITYGGDCSSPTTVATLGFNTVTFNMLPVGVHSNCTIKITDSLGNVSNTLAITPFTVVNFIIPNQPQQPNPNTNSTVGCTYLTKYSPITSAKCPNYIPPQTTFVDTNPVICPHFTKYLKRGSKMNDTNEMMRWQAFLNQYNNEFLTIDGKFGRLTYDAIRNFQAKYAADILAPWGITSPTGYIYKSTRAKANQIFGCSEGVVVLDNGKSINLPASNR